MESDSERSEVYDSSDLFSESSDTSGDDAVEEEAVQLQGIQPYMYEPVVGSSDDSDNDAPPAVRNDDDDVENRLGNSQWCVNYSVLALNAFIRQFVNYSS